MRWLATHPIRRMLLLFSFCTVVWVPFVLAILTPLTVRVLIHYHQTTDVWLTLMSLIGTLLGELLLPLLLWFFIRGPYAIAPLFPESNRKTFWERAFVMVTVLVVLELFVLKPSTSLMVGLVVLVKYLVVGYAEEWSFRGVIIKVLHNRMSLIYAVLISSVLFALFHWAELIFIMKVPFGSVSWWMSLGYDFLLGLYFSFIVWGSRSILWGAMIHGLGDWTGTWGSVSWFSPNLVVFMIGIVGTLMLRYITSSRGHKNQTRDASTHPEKL